jgi:hypothetical protein
MASASAVSRPFMVTATSERYGSSRNTGDHALFVQWVVAKLYIRESLLQYPSGIRDY